jgi:hypothetical protein
MFGSGSSIVLAVPSIVSVPRAHSVRTRDALTYAVPLSRGGGPC